MVTLSQQSPTKGVEEEIRKGKGNLVRRNSQNLVVLTHHSAIDNQRDTFQLGIWVGCYDTSGDTRELS